MSNPFFGGLNSYTYEVARNRIPNQSTQNKFGYNLDVDTGTEEIIASYGGAFDYASDIITTAQTFTITYNSSTDGLGTTGATSLFITYIDADYHMAEGVHVLGSDGSDVTSFTGFGINRVVVLSSGSDGVNNNDINITATTDTTQQARVPAGQSVTQQCIFHTPINYSFMTDWMLINVLKLSGGSAPRVTIKGYSYSRVTSTNYEIFRTNIDTSIINTLQLTPSQPFVLGGREVLYFTCETNTNNTEISMRYSGILSKV